MPRVVGNIWGQYPAKTTLLPAFHSPATRVDPQQQCFINITPPPGHSYLDEGWATMASFQRNFARNRQRGGQPDRITVHNWELHFKLRARAAIFGPGSLVGRERMRKR